MNRRAYLATTTGALAALAGCSTQSDSDSTPTNTQTNDPQSGNSGTPYFEDVSITGPRTITVGSEFTLTIEATNTGGRSGEFATQITANPQAFTNQSYSVNIPDVPPGETASTTLGPLAPQVAGEFRFVSGNYSAQHTLTVESLDGALGDTRTLPNNVSITPESVDVARAYFYADTDTPAVYTPSEDNRCLVLVHLTVENTGSEPATLPASTSFGLVRGEETSGATLISPNIDVDGTPYRGGDEVSAGRSRSGWLLFEPRDTLVEDGPELGLARGGGAPGEAYWQLGAVSTGRTPPSFDATVTTDTIESLVENELAIDVTNTGGLDGVYRDVIELSELNSEFAFGQTRIEQPVAADATTTATGSLSINRVGQARVESQAQGFQTGVDVIPAQLATGETVTTPTGIDIQVSEFRLTRGDSIRYESGDETRSASPSGQFFLAFVDASNTGDEQPLPSASDFLADPDDHGTYTPYYIGEEVVLTSPVTGDGYTIYGDSPNRESGAQHSGYLMFEVPLSVTFDDAIVRWESTTRDVEGAAEWQRQR